VELHPAAVLFVLVLGGAVYGLLGAILAVPIAAHRNLTLLTFLISTRAPNASAGLRTDTLTSHLMSP
jgi:predicted PurR-regulated permease PerM